jgi:hypothetical protein
MRENLLLFDFTEPVACKLSKPRLSDGTCGSTLIGIADLNGYIRTLKFINRATYVPFVLLDPTGGWDVARESRLPFRYLAVSSLDLYY